MSVGTEDDAKVAIDWTAVAKDYEAVSGAEERKAGDRVSVQEADFFSGASDFVRVKLAAIDPAQPNPVELATYASDLTITINNNAAARKAITKMGAINIGLGTFEVDGEMTTYFQDMRSIKAMIANDSVTLDAVMVFDNRGIVVDLPLVSMTTEGLSIEADNDVMLPITNAAAESPFGHTLLWVFFPYLPSVAAPANN